MVSDLKTARSAARAHAWHPHPRCGRAGRALRARDQGACLGRYTYRAFGSSADAGRSPAIKTAPSKKTAVIAFLASDDASYVNGVALDVNGGLFMA